MGLVWGWYRANAANTPLLVNRGVTWGVPELGWYLPRPLVGGSAVISKVGGRFSGSIFQGVIDAYLPEGLRRPGWLGGSEVPLQGGQVRSSTYTCWTPRYHRPVHAQPSRRYRLLPLAKGSRRLVPSPVKGLPAPQYVLRASASQGW